MANNLTLTSATFDSTGQKFGAGALSGGYGVAPGGLIPALPCAWECWFKRSSAPGALGVIMGQSGLGWFGMTSSGAIQFEFGTNPAVDFTTSGSYADGNWHHAAISAGPNGFTAFVDGAVVGSSSAAPGGVQFAASGSPPSAIGYLAVGNHGGSLQFPFGGEVDEAAVWAANRYTAAFTPPAAAYTGTETGLLALWHLDGNGADSTAGSSWTQLIAYKQQAAAATGAIGNGWTDVGPSWSGVTSGGNSYMSSASIAGAPWNTNQIVRKASSEAAINTRVQARFAVFETADLWLMLRYSAPNGDGSATALMAKPGQFFVLANGQLGTTGGTSVAPTPGNWYDLDVKAVQQDANTTILTVTTYNVGDPINSAFGSGSQFTNNTFTVTDAAVQNLSGGQGMFFYDSAQNAAGKLVYEFTTFSGDGTVQAATTYTLTGPSSGAVGAASGPFTVELSGSTASAITVTPSDGAAGGTFSPTTVTFGAGSTNATASFTYTPAAAGAETISVTNSGQLTNPAALTYTANSLKTLGVTSAAFRFSPGNWSGDAGRGGVNWRRSWTNGAWAEVVWTAGATPTATFLLNSPNSACRLSYLLNGVLTDNVAASGNIILSGIIPNALNILRVYLRSSPQSQRWAGGSNTVQVLGHQIDGGSSAGIAATGRMWGLMPGDSITEGIAADGGADDHLMDYSFLVARALEQLGYDVGISACGYSGWIHTGDGNPGDVPAYYAVSGSSNGAGGTYSDAGSRWNKVDAGVSLLDSNGIMSAYGASGTPPAFVYINYMTNEALSGLSVSDAQASVTQALAALRAAAPGAWLFIQVPFGIYHPAVYGNQAYTAALKAGVAAYRAANPADARIKLIDFGPMLSETIEHAPYINSDNVHPIAAGHALVAPMVAQAIVSSLMGQVRSPTYR